MVRSSERFWSYHSVAITLSENFWLAKKNWRNKSRMLCNLHDFCVFRFFFIDHFFRCGAVYGLTKDWRLLGLHTYMSMAAAFVTAFMVQVVLLQYQMALHNPDIHVLLIYLVSMLAVCWEDVDTWLLSKYRQRGRCAIPAGSPPIKSSSSNRAIRFTSAPIVSAESGDVGVAASKSGLNKESATTINTESSSSVSVALKGFAWWVAVSKLFFQLRTLPSDESVESRSSEEVCHRHNRWLFVPCTFSSVRSSSRLFIEIFQGKLWIWLLSVYVAANYVFVFFEPLHLLCSILPFNDTCGKIWHDDIPIMTRDVFTANKSGSGKTTRPRSPAWQILMEGNFFKPFCNSFSIFVSEGHFPNAEETRLLLQKRSFDRKSVFWSKTHFIKIWKVF